MENETTWKIAAQRSDVFQPSRFSSQTRSSCRCGKSKEIFCSHFIRVSFSSVSEEVKEKEKSDKLRSSIAKIWLFLRSRVCALSQFAKQIKNSFAEASPSETAKEEKSFPFDLNGKTAELDQREHRGSSSDRISFHFRHQFFFSEGRNTKIHILQAHVRATKLQNSK